MQAVQDTHPFFINSPSTVSRRGLPLVSGRKMVRAPEIAHARAIIKYGIAVQMLDCKFHGSYNLGWTEMDGAG